MGYRETAAHNMVALQTAAGDVLEGARRAGLDTLVIPGASLLPLYPDLGCRPMDDIDILVRPGQMDALRDFLSAQGFSSPLRHPDLWQRRGVVLDLHEDLLNCGRIEARRYAGWMDLEEVWHDSEERMIEGTCLGVMCRADEILYTVVHALRHSFRRLTWFFDLYFLLDGLGDWQFVQEKARRYHLQRPLLYSLRFLQERLDLPLSAEVHTWVEEEGVSMRRGEEYLLQCAWRDRLERDWGDLLWSFNISNRVQQCRFLLETFFPSPSVLLQVFPYLPRFLFPLAYALRLGQLVYKSGRHLTGLVWRDQQIDQRDN
jgi:hypothetical protein